MAGGVGIQRNRQPAPPPSNGQGNYNSDDQQYQQRAQQMQNGQGPPQDRPQYQSQFQGLPQNSNHQQFSGQPQNFGQQQFQGPYQNGQQFSGQPSNVNNIGIPRPRSGGYDGPGELSQQRPRQNPYAPGLGYDPARPAAQQPRVITNSRVELPASAYKLEGVGYEFPTELPLRPGTNSVGKPIQIRLNQFKVSQWPQRDVYQYDILIGNGAEKKGKVMAVWKSRTVQSKLATLINGPWLWDGNKIAWCNFPVPEQRIMVDLDAEKGRQRTPPELCYVVIRPTKQIRMAVIQSYLSKQMPFDNSVLEAINFLDHAIRQWPSEQYTSIKRSFFSRGANSYQIDNCIVAMKGVYTSIRLCDPKPSVGAPSTGLALNVDVANGTFWASQDVHQAARNYCGGGNRALSYTNLRDQLLPVMIKGGITYSESFKLLRKMVKLKFVVKHRGKQENEKKYSIKGFTWEKLKEGSHAKNTSFTLKARNGRPEEVITVYAYYKRQYNIDLQHWYLPLIKTTRDGMFPMELCTLCPNQRYMYKLGPDQTAAMIKFAVTRPKERIQSIQHGTGMLKWNEDPYLKHFGVKVDPNMTLTNARLLQNPEVQYDKAKVNPGTTGRWDLRGKKFLFGNPEPLKSWGVVVIGGCVDEPTVRNFLQIFIQTYVGHGGKVENKNPVVCMGKQGEDLGDLVAAARTKTGNQSQSLPQILFFILPSRDSFVYERLKKNMECRFAMVSQMMNIAHVKKAQPQYCSNLCMKVNAKLGGTTCKVVSPKAFFSRPTMIIGADVSHPSPGSQQPSMAAITMSFDTNACRYAAAVQTNGHRVEMITPLNINNMLMPLFGQWIGKVGNGGGPHHIYYFRDGVSEGQYAHVINQEVAEMKKLVTAKYGPAGAAIKWTVVVCTKRHHIRFFPKDGDATAGDKNGNPLPGTLVERDVTHPFEHDFYLSSHSAIQGTARPVHYHVILDEAQVPVNDLHKMVYQHCYQYMRSTTPVSLYPAVYYAHLASNRARAHEAAAASEGPRGGQKFEEARQDAAVNAARRGNTADGSSQTGSSLPTEAKPLLPLGNPEQGEAMLKIRTGMWYI